MFERFTEAARRVVVLAQEEARMLNHHYIGTEHLMLGLVHQGEGVAGQAFESLGISLTGVRGQVEEIVGVGRDEPSGHIPFTPRAKTALELSLREALQLKHQYIGAEHLLLGLLTEGSGVGIQAIERLGVSRVRLRQEILLTIGEKEPAAGPTSGEHPTARARGAESPTVGEVAAIIEENARLHRELARLRTLLRRHGIDAGQSS